MEIKKTKILMIIILLSVGTVKNLNAVSFSGSGTEQDPYLLSTEAHLSELADSVNRFPMKWNSEKYFEVMNDITDTVRTIIGSYERKFQGNFCGNNKIINLALTINSVYVGLFGYIDTIGVVKNVEVNGYIYNEHFSYSTFPRKAGIASTNEGKISNCINRCPISIYSNSMTGDYAGGITAINWGIVDNCLNSGNIEVFYHDVGGIAAWNYETISNSTNTGSVTAKVYGAGGIAGFTWPGGAIFNCVNTGAVTALMHASGITYCVGGTVSNCSNYGFIKGNSYIGGISSVAQIAIIINNFNNGVVEGNEYVGCIVGSAETTPWSPIPSIIENNHYDKQMCGEE